MKKIQHAKIVIIAVIICLLLIPQLVGTTTTAVEKTDDMVTTRDELAGRTLVTLADADTVGQIAARMEGCDIVSADSMDEMVSAVTSEEAFGMIVSKSERDTILAEDPELKVMPGVVTLSNTGTEDDWYYILLRSENAYFATTSRTVEDAGKPGTKIACLVGTTFADQLPELFPDAEIEYYNTNADMNEAVSTGKADFGQWYSVSMEQVIMSYSNLAEVGQTIYSESACFALPKNEKGDQLTEEFDAFLEEVRENGTLEEIEYKWYYREPETPDLDYTFTGENGTLQVVTGGTWEPMTFYMNGQLTGVYIELISAFCQEYGYTPEFTVADYGAELAGVTTGVYDIMADIVAETPERAEEVNLTTPVYRTNYCLTTVGDVQMTETTSKATQFFGNLRASFVKTFITENRWQMILSGLEVTIAMAVLAALFGTLLGALICAMRMSRFAYADAFAQLYIKVIQGTPIVILLLVLYYIILGTQGVSAFWVSVIGFSLDFAAYSSEIFRTGIESIPVGQSRAAAALGFGRGKAFIKVIFPQALVRILPVYNGQLISMVKLTSVAGYISVMDLTKASDLIRSRTFEAFFPLISTAVIYFVISALLVTVLRKIEEKMDPAKRSRKVKGVVEHD